MTLCLVCNNNNCDSNPLLDSKSALSSSSAPAASQSNTDTTINLLRTICKCLKIRFNSHSIQSQDGGGGNEDIQKQDKEFWSKILSGSSSLPSAASSLCCVSCIAKLEKVSQVQLQIESLLLARTKLINDLLLDVNSPSTSSSLSYLTKVGEDDGHGENENDSSGNHPNHVVSTSNEKPAAATTTSAANNQKKIPLVNNPRKIINQLKQQIFNHFRPIDLLQQEIFDQNYPLFLPNSSFTRDKAIEKEANSTLASQAAIDPIYQHLYNMDSVEPPVLPAKRQPDQPHKKKLWYKKGEGELKVNQEALKYNFNLANKLKEIQNQHKQKSKSTSDSDSIIDRRNRNVKTAGEGQYLYRGKFAFESIPGSTKYRCKFKPTTSSNNDSDDESSDENGVGDKESVNVCGYISRSFPSMVLHLRSHDPNQPFVLKRRKRRTELIEDSSSQTEEPGPKTRCMLGPQLFTEDCEDGTFLTGDKWKFHRIQDDDEDDTKDGVKNENEAPEKPVTRYECDTCGKITLKKRLMSTHIRNAHAFPLHFTCDICSHEFTIKSHYDNHLLSHSKEKPYICHICGAAYKKKSYFNEHVKSHEGVFKCPEENCDKVYTCRQSLRQHLENHENVKNLMCPHCGTFFSKAKLLKRHIESVHQKLVKWICPVPECGLGFVHRTSWVRHAKTCKAAKGYRNSGRGRPKKYL